MVIAVKLDSFRVAAAGHYQPVEFRVQVYVAGAERLTGGDKADLLIDGLELVYKLIVYIGQGRFIDKALQRAEQTVNLPDKGLVNAQNGRALVGVDLQQLLTLERSEGFTHGHVARTVALGDLFYSDAAAGFDLLADYILAQTLGDLGGNRAFKDYFLCHNDRSVFRILPRNSFFVHNIIKRAADCQ